MFNVRQTRKGVLLFGPPGCAKTLIAQAVATESNQNFLAVKGSELIKMYVGESERAIRDVFRRARAAKPCIIFFDEIDSIGKSREKTQDSGLNVVTTLLNEMDGIEALKDVFIIGATNRPDILDSALIRKGRFDAHIHIGLPTENARRQIIEIHTRDQPLAGDVDLNNLASRTEGSSGADISGLCVEAVDLAMVRLNSPLHPASPLRLRALTRLWKSFTDVDSLLSRPITSTRLGHSLRSTCDTSSRPWRSMFHIRTGKKPNVTRVGNRGSRCPRTEGKQDQLYTAVLCRRLIRRTGRRLCGYDRTFYRIRLGTFDGIGREYIEPASRLASPRTVMPAKSPGRHRANSVSQTKGAILDILVEGCSGTGSSLPFISARSASQNAREHMFCLGDYVSCFSSEGGTA